MPIQDLSVGSTASRRSSSGLGSRTSEPKQEKTSWWDNFKASFSSSGGDDSSMSNPEDPSDRLPVVDFGDDDSVSADIYDQPEFTYEPEVFAAVTDAGKANVFYTPDDILQEAYDADMAGKGEDKPDPLGNMGVPPATLKDVTDTDEGALSNPDPLYKMAEEVRTPTISTTVLDDEGKPLIDIDKITNIQDVRSDSALAGTTTPEQMSDAIGAALDEVDLTPPEEADQELIPAGGLMSRPSSPIPKLRPLDFKTPEQKTYETDYVNAYLKHHEGTKAHKSLEGGKDTAAYGVKFSLGLDRDNYSSDAHFAAAVALKHKDKVVSSLGKDKFESLPKSVQYGLVDLNFNAGTIGKTAAKPDAKSMMENTLLYTGMKTKSGTRATVMSLAKRRAYNWNKAASDMGVQKIKKIKLTPQSSGARYTYEDAKGNVIKTFTTTRTPVKLKSSGAATALTKTEVYTF